MYIVVRYLFAKSFYEMSLSSENNDKNPMPLAGINFIDGEGVVEMEETRSRSLVEKLLGT